MNSHTDFDVAIVGAGPVGLAFAGCLANIWGEQAKRIAIFDAKPLEAASQDPRILALSEATRLRLANLGFPSAATPIHHIHVSEQSRFGQGDLAASLSASLQSSGVAIFRPANVISAQPSATNTPEIIRLEDGTEFTTRLRVDAEGGLYGQTDERDQVVDYGQWALVSELTVSVEPSLLSGNNTLAFERFTSEGPLALLPISTDQRTYSLVWCAPLSSVQRRMACSNEQFANELRQQFGRRIQIEHIGPKKCFPLGMNRLNTLVQGRRVAIGNAAQILHPVAGQGLNLGLRDAVALCRRIKPSTVAEEHRLQVALDEFEKSRATDRQVVVKITDSMVKGFSNHNPLLGVGRQMALNLMELTPPFRKQFAELMLFGLAS